MADDRPSRQKPAEVPGSLGSLPMDLALMPPPRVGVESAWYGHVPFAQWLVGAIRPGLVVELGAHNGVSYAAFCEAVVRSGAFARCCAVDTWSGDEHAGFYDGSVYESLRRFHDLRYGSFSELLRGTFDDAVPYFADGSIDLLHIDGLHTYDAVRHDWETWRPKLSARGVVLFHDINEHQGSFGVWRLWAELQQAYPHFAFLHAHGLGVLAVGPEAPEAVAALCALTADPGQAGRLRTLFAQLGARWDVQQEFSHTLALRQAAEAGVASLTAELAGARQELVSAAPLRAALHELKAQVASREAEEVRTRAELTAAQRRALADLAALRAERERLAKELDAANSNLARADLAAELAARQQFELNEAYSHQGELERMAAAREGEVTYLHGQLATRAEDWERVHVVLRLREAALADALWILDETRRSVSWRLTAPLRAVSRSMPGVARGMRRARQLTSMAVTGGLTRRRALRRQREAEIVALRGCKLFDAAYYLQQHPDIAAAGHDPAAHYAWVGAQSGARPNPWFDGGWYLAQNPSVTGNPLLHWQDHGAALGLNPNPFLSATWYRTRYPDAGPDALLHYMQVGAAQDRDPNPMLDAEAYKLQYPHARESGLDALLHWWQFGAGMGFNPNPLFDVAWYRQRNGLPPGTDPLAHWLAVGEAARLPTSALVERTGGVLQTMHVSTPADPAVSVIVPVYGHYADTVRCLYALLTGSGNAHRYEVLVVDDDPAQRTAPLLARRIPGLRCIENPVNLGFLRSCNNSAGKVGGDVLVFLNNDTAVHPGWLDPIVELMEREPRAGLVGCKLLNPDGTVQEAGGSVGSDGWGIPYGLNDDPAKPEYNYVRQVDVAIGACIAVRRAAWTEVGGFDERYAPAFYEEFDLAFALRDWGWQVFYQPATVVDHLGSHSYGTEARDRHTIASHAKFCAKWATALRAQPAPRSPAFRLRERPAPAGTILFIDDRVPEWDRHAGALTNRHYIAIWQKMGYKVVFVPAALPVPLQPYTARLQQEGVEVLYAPETLAAWLGRNGRFVDVIWTARPDVTGPILDLLRTRCDAPILYYTHDLHSLREQRRWELERDPQALEDSRRYRAIEHRIFAGVDRVFSLSTAEAAIIREEVPSADVHVIPIFIYPEPPALPDAAAFEERDMVLFVGGYGHLPNVDAARFLASEVMPLVWRQVPHARLVLAGSSPPPEVQGLAAPGVEVPGFVEDLTPYYAHARVSVSPVRYGAGVKGKVVAALWEGVPVVTTSVGNEGLNLVDREQAMIADGAEALAAAVLALWNDPDLSLDLAKAGQRVVAERFTADAATRIMTDLVKAGRRPGTGQRRPAA